MPIPHRKVGDYALLSKNVAGRQHSWLPDQRFWWLIQFSKNAPVRLCARKTVILKNHYFTASVEQDWETNEHTAFSFG